MMEMIFLRFQKKLRVLKNNSACTVLKKKWTEKHPVQELRKLKEIQKQGIHWKEVNPNLGAQLFRIQGKLRGIYPNDLKVALRKYCSRSNQMFIILK